MRNTKRIRAKLGINFKQEIGFGLAKNKNFNTSSFLNNTIKIHPNLALI
jgi:hypothetical protein